uniref:Galectin n=1 Tax=Lepisosteus oculatus TaxID=7918 RepID=W5MZU0_LEPOC
MGGPGLLVLWAGGRPSAKRLKPNVRSTVVRCALIWGVVIRRELWSIGLRFTAGLVGTPPFLVIGGRQRGGTESSIRKEGLSTCGNLESPVEVEKPGETCFESRTGPSRLVFCSARPTSCRPKFAINVGSSSSDLALHFNPRFYDYTAGGQNSIVMNSAPGGSWGREQRESHFPFKRGEKFTMSITHNGNSFGIKLPDDRVISFPNRLGRDSYDHVSFYGDIQIFSIKAEVGGAGQASF